MRIAKRRRREFKTDYKARFSLLKSGLLRLVVRKTDHYLIAHIVASKEAQDSTIVYANSKELSKFGWPLNPKNLAAAYLSGFLLGKKYLKNNKKPGKLILDSGLQRSTKESRIYGVVKGVVDAGVEVLCDSKMFPKQERINMEYKNKKIKELLENVKKEIEKNA